VQAAVANYYLYPKGKGGEESGGETERRKKKGN